MEKSSLTMKIMMSILVVGVVTYLAVYFFLGWNESLVTTKAYEATVNLGSSASAILAREEVVVTGATTGYVSLSPNEGERVSAGDTVAVVYSDSSGLETSAEIRTLAAEIEQLSYAISSGNADVDATKLDQSILSSIITLRSLAAKGDLSTLEDAALNLRTMVFQRDYAYTGEGMQDAAALIRQKQEQLISLQSSLGRVATTIAAPVPGVFSGDADGFETLITPENVWTLEPSQLKELMSQQPQTPAGAVGRIITSSVWYLAALMDEEDAASMKEGSTFTVTFSYDWYGSVEMTLERVSDAEDGMVVCLFSARRNLSDTAMLRVQTVDISTQEITGIRIPPQSLRILTDEKTDEETGKTTQTQRAGVYTVVGSQAEFQEVDVLYFEGDYYLVEPVDPYASHRLRVGDEVIVNAENVYDGKVVR